MNRRARSIKMFSSFRPVALASVAAGLGASALTPGAVHAQSIESYEQSGWFVRAGGVARFNVKTTLTQTTTPLAIGYYDNGFVLPDNGGTASGKTWNWGYTSGLQGNQLVLSRYDSLPTIGKNDVSTPNPLFGAELIGGFQYSPFLMGNKTAHLRIEIGYGYSSFSQNLGYAGFSDASFTTDSFGTGGIVVPEAPYAGTAAGPGPLIDLNPTAHLVANSPSTTTFNG